MDCLDRQKYLKHVLIVKLLIGSGLFTFQTWTPGECQLILCQRL